MHVHALTTGTALLKDAFVHARLGPLRQARLFLPGSWHGPFPVLCWLVEHDGRRLLVDTGEVATARDIPFARFTMRSPAEEELPGRLAALGVDVGSIDTVVLTHLHADHMDGAVHVACPVLVHEEEWAWARTLQSRVFARLLHQPIPRAVRWRGFALDDGPFGAFAASKRLTDDGRVVAVALPGHTPGHLGVICIADDGTHLLLAGDATDTLEQLHARRPDAVAPDPAVHVDTLDRILRHAQDHPTVVLPSHDPESEERLEAMTTL